MRYEIKNKEIHIFIPVSSSGKFRFKTRENNFSFGKSFATRSNNLREDVYLEWQIGYDTTIKDVKESRKHTNLKHLSFAGYNGKSKHPYELSELMSEAVKIGLIKTESVRELANELKHYTEYLSSREIDIKNKGILILNDVSFEETVIQLPTFFVGGLLDGAQIEVSVQKQQYATGVQPMLYFSIPIYAFRNGQDFYGRTSKRGDELIYVIDEGNAQILLLMFKVFGMASPSHNHDVKEILGVLLNQG